CFHVTGVQTCALPIWEITKVHEEFLRGTPATLLEHFAKSPPRQLATGWRFREVLQECRRCSTQEFFVDLGDLPRHHQRAGAEGGGHYSQCLLNSVWRFEKDKRPLRLPRVFDHPLQLAPLARKKPQKRELVGWQSRADQ